MSSASHEDSATKGYFLDAREMAAWLYMKTYPDVECLVAHSEFENPSIGRVARSKLRPMDR
eukprot:6177887-Pleurochrysis_carterae.AAC.1